MADDAPPGDEDRDELERLVAARTAELDANARRLARVFALSETAPKLTETELLKQALDIAVDVTHSRIGYLHLVNEDQDSLMLSTWNDEALKYCTAAHDDHYPLSKAGIWADSVRRRAPVVHNRYQAEPLKRGYPDGHFHVERHMSTPVTDGERVSLIVGVGNKDSDYNDADVVQLQTVANDIERIIIRRRMEEALKISKQEAEDANTAKSQFLAAMSHDLRTPLNAILGFSDMMRQKTFGPLGDPHYEGYAEDIYNSGSLLISLINDVLDLSKIEAGKYTLKDERLGVAQIVATSLHQLETMARRNGVALHAAIPEDLPDLRGDERALIQVLNNLVSNAVKFTPEGGSVTVTAEISADGGHILRVTDTGVGMTEDGVAKALAPFEQVDSAHARRHEGTGLGLSLCVNFMTLFGGALEMESEPGVGTTVTLRFPVGRVVE